MNNKLIKIFFASILFSASFVSSGFSLDRDCSAPKGIINGSINNASVTSPYKIGYLNSANEKYVAQHGNFRFKMGLILDDKMSLNIIQQADYSVIISNLSSYLAAYPDHVWELKSAIAYSIVTKLLPSGEKFVKEQKFNTQDEIDQFISMWRASDYYPTRENSILDYADFLTAMLFEDQTHKIAGEKNGFIIDFYPVMKKQLLLAIIIGDFTKVNEILKNRNILNVSEMIKRRCIE